MCCRWVELADETYHRRQFPNVSVAAVDGDSEYYNYKGFYSVVFMALVTYDYSFLFHDAGCQGRISDAGVWENTKFCKKMKR